MNKKTILSTLLFTTASLLTTQMAVAKDDESSKEKTLCEAQAYEMALRWQQKSGEVKALQLQAYNIAKKNFDEIIEKHDDDKKPAIVLDLDETVIDNTPLLVRDMQNCHDYTSWDTWKDEWEVQEGEPFWIPGAKEFLEYADSKGVKIYYVSDRYHENKDANVNVLKKMGLPQVSHDNTLLTTKPKVERRADIEEEYKIVMLFGDTLADFHDKYLNDKSEEEQRELVAESKDHFGYDWIVLPNATYGSWTEAELEAWDYEAEDK